LTHSTFISLDYPLYHRCTLGVALVYLVFYQSVLDPRGIHLYIILSPRCVRWLICLRDMTRLCARLVHMCGMTRSSVWDRSISTLSSHLRVWYDAFTLVTWLVHVWETDPSLHYPLIPVCDMTHLCRGHGLFMRVTWLVDLCGMTCSSVWDRSISTLSSRQGVWYYPCV